MKTTNDPKDHTIKLRLNEDMHRYVLETSKRQGTTVSGFIRDMIERDMKGSGGHTEN